MNKNDERILILKNAIADQKEQLKELKKHKYKTNMVLDIDAKKHNLHVIQKDAVIALLIRFTSELNALKTLKSDYEVDLQETYLVSGYSLSDWIEDLRYQLQVLTTKNQELKLKRMESQLDAMLSEDKRTELLIDELAKSLGI